MRRFERDLAMDNGISKISEGYSNGRVIGTV